MQINANTESIFDEKTSRWKLCLAWSVSKEAVCVVWDNG